MKFGYVQLGDLYGPLKEPDSLPFGDIPDIEGLDFWRFEHGEMDAPDFTEYREARELLYDTILKYVDSEIEKFLHELKHAYNTIIVVTSNHGEEFWDYTEFEMENFDDPRGIAGVGHGHALVPPLIEVPIATNIEGLGTDTRASTVDIVPTILHKLGARDERQLNGLPLQDTPRKSPVLSQEIAYGPNQISVAQGDDHLIYIPAKDVGLFMDFSTGELQTDQERKAELIEYIPNEKRVGESVTLSTDVKDSSLISGTQND